MYKLYICSENGNEKINTFNPIVPVSFVVCVSCCLSEARMGGNLS